MTEEYNGSGWTEDGNLNTVSTTVAQDLVLKLQLWSGGGYVNGSGDVANVEEYNGSSWTEVNNIFR